MLRWEETIDSVRGKRHFTFQIFGLFAQLIRAINYNPFGHKLYHDDVLARMKEYTLSDPKP